MSKETAEFDTPPDNINLPITNSNHSSVSNTKMFILPPNILQSICIGDSIAKDGSSLPAIGLITKDNTLNDVITKEHKDYETAKPIENSTNSNIVTKPATVVKVNKSKPIDNTDIEIGVSATKVPRLNRNKEKLMSKTRHMEQVKGSFHIIEKQNDKGKIDKSTTDSLVSQKGLCEIKFMTDNVEDSQTTSNGVLKPEGADIRSEQYSNKKSSDRNSGRQRRTKSKYESNKNLLERSKRIRKQTNFDDYIITRKKELIKNESTILNQGKKSTSNKEEEQVINISNLSATVKASDINNLKTSVKEEPQNMRNKMDKTAIHSHVAHTSNTPAVTKKSLPLKSGNISENDSTVQNNDNFFASHLQNSENVINDTCMNVKCVKDTISNENLKCINTNTIDNKNETTSNTIIPINQNHNSQTILAVPLVRKRGRPRNNSLPRQLPDTLNESEENLETSQKINNVSITETVVHSKRHGEKSYNITSNDGLSDDSSTEDNTSNSYVARKRGRPPGTGKSRGKNKSRHRAGGRGRGRGRGKGTGLPYSTLDTEYVPKLKGPIATEKMKQEENSTEIINEKTSHIPEVDLVICAKCETKLPKRQWNSHNLQEHNNMSWIKGDEPMDFENDIKLLRRVLITAHKKRRGQLTCEKCGAIKRSVNGFISHMQFCGKSNEEKKALLVKCPICGATMMPSSMEIHERTHRRSEQSRIKELQLYTSDNEKVKRKAAEKAVTKILEFTELVKNHNSSSEKKLKLDASSLKSVIKTPSHKKSIPAVWKGIWKKELRSKGTVTCRHIGCTFICSSFEEICKHFAECNFIPQECYVCKICKFSTTSDEDMIKHVTEQHMSVVGIDRYSDFEEENYSSDERTSSYTMKFLDKEQVYKIRWSEPYFPTIRWTMEFEQKNYDLHSFKDYTPNNFTLLKDTEMARYLPQLEVSMKTKTQGINPEKSSNTEIPWKQWKRFEGGFDEGTATFFVGGPVWALAWLPIPSPMYSTEPVQYVAISTHPTMESEYTVGKAYSGANMIQIWNVGPLDNEIDNTREPALSYAVAHNGGTVWCLEWCPSGCYQDESLNNCKRENEIESSLKRMGMLAAACSDGNVYIYSLPFPEELEINNTEENEWPIYHTDPVMTLVVNIPIHDRNGQNWQCTKLSWSKEHGHNTIAAGFSNGYIALWDLTYKSPLSMHKRQNTWFVNAFQQFYAHGNAVSMVVLIPFNGARFLASGGLDRAYKFWNLEDTSTPQNCTQKGIILDGAWMTHWPCAVISFDDALGYKHTNSYLIPLRDQECRYYPILATNSPTYALSVSDYANSIAHGTLAGEVVTVFPHQLVSNREVEKAIQKKRKLSSYVKIVDFSETENGSKNDKKDKKNSKDYDYMPETYNECKDRFGVIFCDNLKNIERYVQPQSLYAEKLTAVPIEEYPFMSVNRISWNPNTWSYLWLVVGYQNGLVRLLSFKYMSMPRELKTWLPQHIEFMLKKTNVTTRGSC